jgi:predicted nucleic acid-binding protein
VKVLFDTSVVIAASLPQHPNHSACFACLLQSAQVQQFDGYLSTHSLAEIYSVLTRMPSQPRITPIAAQSIINSHLQYLETVSLNAADYQLAIAQMTILQLPGGGIFDALIAQAALKISANRLLTLNPKHFTRLSPAIAQITVSP